MLDLHSGHFWKQQEGVQSCRSRSPRVLTTPGAAAQFRANKWQNHCRSAEKFSLAPFNLKPLDTPTQSWQQSKIGSKGPTNKQAHVQDRSETTPLDIQNIQHANNSKQARTWKHIWPDWFQQNKWYQKQSFLSEITQKQAQSLYPSLSSLVKVGTPFCRDCPWFSLSMIRVDLQEISLAFQAGWRAWSCSGGWGGGSKLKWRELTLP